MKRKWSIALIQVEIYETEEPSRMHVFDLYFMCVLVFRKKSYAFIRSF